MLHLRFWAIIGIAWLASWAQSSSHPYDKAASFFSPKGELIQIEYAKKACQQGRSVLCGIGSDDLGVICIPESRSALPLLDQQSMMDKFARVDDHAIVICTGLAADARMIIKMARNFVVEYRSTYGVVPSVHGIANFIGQQQHSFTLGPQTRPLAVESIVFGYNQAKKCLEIYKTDPGGRVDAFRAVCIGRNAGSNTKKLESRWQDTWDCTLLSESLKNIVLGAWDDTSKSSAAPEDDSESNSIDRPPSKDGDTADEDDEKEDELITNIFQVRWKKNKLYVEKTGIDHPAQ